MPGPATATPPSRFTSKVTGRPVVVRAVDGATVNPENLIKSVGPTLPTTDRREVKVELTPDKAKSTTEDANAQVPKEVIGQFTTSFPHAD